jgi:hypothetical protein
MADEKPRAPRARKKGTDAAAKSVVKKKTDGRTVMTRKATVEAARPDDVATVAYLLWEQGESGDATEHWLRAEQQLAAA